MSRTINEFVTIYCNTCGKGFHPKYGKEITARFCSVACSRQPYLDKEHILQSRIRNSSKSVETGCWEWTGGKNENGYGMMRIGTRMVRSHRVSYMAFKGEIPDGMVVCHSCDNPACVNPDHLWIGTKADNTRDMIEKGRSRLHTNKIRGSSHKLSKLTEDDVIRIREDSRAHRIIAAQYGVSHVTIQRIKSRHVWAWLE